jgi:hypothetical protein
MQNECLGGWVVFSLRKNTPKVLGFLSVNTGRQSGLGCGAKLTDNGGDLGSGFA